MARPRTKDTGLPVGVYLRHGAYYHVQGGRWTWLTRERSDVEVRLSEIVKRVPASMEQVARYAQRVLARSRANAKGRRGLQHSLTEDDVLRLLWKSKWRCAVTGTPFSLVEMADGQKPYAPSIDRIDNTRGYEPDNCRVVCVITNFAMNTWGAEPLRHIASHMRNMAGVLDSTPSQIDGHQESVEKSST